MNLLTRLVTLEQKRTAPTATSVYEGGARERLTRMLDAIAARRSERAAPWNRK